MFTFGPYVLGLVGIVSLQVSLGFALAYWMERKLSPRRHRPT